MINEIYNLPDITFIGGESKSLIFDLSTENGGVYDADGCTVAFSVVRFSDKNSAPVLIKSATIETGSNGVDNLAIVDLDPDDTVNLNGRYVYQISIRDTLDATEIPGRGIMNIVRNIHKEFITN